MEKLIEIFLMENITDRTKIQLLKVTGNALNIELAGNFTEELVIELCLMINPELEPFIAKDEHYKYHYNRYISRLNNESDWG